MRKDVRKKFVPGKKCERENCEQTADYVVETCGEFGDYYLMLLCSNHADSANDHYEYIVNCPNCNCRFGVG